MARRFLHFPLPLQSWLPASAFHPLEAFFLLFLAWQTSSHLRVGGTVPALWGCDPQGGTWGLGLGPRDMVGTRGGSAPPPKLGSCCGYSRACNACVFFGGRRGFEAMLILHGAPQGFEAESNVGCHGQGACLCPCHPAHCHQTGKLRHK